VKVPETKYPQVEVPLIAQDGNAFAILGRVRKALEAAGVPEEELMEFWAEATSDDYGHLLQTVVKWVSVS